MESEFQRLTMGSTHQTIYMPDIERFVTPVPPLNEQDEIVKFVRAQTTQIDVLRDKAREAIEKLKEYRTALISAAVTGKIDVRENTKDDHGGKSPCLRGQPL
jgi:restriction endonuclease S subunit